jgi:hypothetical protein
MKRSRDRLTHYRGLAIVVRWTELERSPDHWGPRGHRFIGSYRVATQDDDDIWQHLPQRVFLSYDAAAAHALAEAKRAVDSRLAAQREPSPPRPATAPSQSAVARPSSPPRWGAGP